jgi:hypothetical protein
LRAKNHVGHDDETNEQHSKHEQEICKTGSGLSVYGFITINTLKEEKKKGKKYRNIKTQTNFNIFQSMSS